MLPERIIKILKRNGMTPDLVEKRRNAMMESV
jgi:hypothetical protein